MPRSPIDLPLPPAAAEALAGGRAVEAVKIVRDTLGLGLRDAHALVARHARDARVAPATTPAGAVRAVPSEDGLVVPPTVVDAVARGEVLEAIRALRAANPHLDLRGARQALEQQRMAGVARTPESRRGRATRVPTVMAGDREGPGWLLAFVLALLGLGWWLFARA